MQTVVDFFRYDLWYGIRNLWTFKRVIWRFRPFDYSFNLQMFAKSIEVTANGIEKYGQEVCVSRIPKIEKMRRFVYLANNIENTTQLAEDQIGPGSYNTKWDEVYKLSLKLEEDMWEEMWTIIRGSDVSYDESIKMYCGKPECTEPCVTSYYTDGTHMRSWWD